MADYTLWLWCYLLKWWINLVVFALFVQVSASNVCHDASVELCGLCREKPTNYSIHLLESFCMTGPGQNQFRNIVTESGNKTLDKRCCFDVDRNCALLGVDLSNCSLTTTKDLPFKNRISLEWIALNSNPINSTNKEDYEGLNRLHYLILPEALDCPGGNNKSWENVTTNDNVRICNRELDFCKAGNVTCPDNSYCTPNGPGLYQCLCNDGWHGYKCLREGQFPFATWLGSIAGGALIIILVLGISQRISKGKSTYKHLATYDENSS